MHPGRVLEAAGGVYTTRLDDGRVVGAALRGRLKLEARTGDRVVAGDRVRVALDGDSASIERVEERSSELARRAPGHGRTARVIVANVERAAIVFAYEHPAPRLRLLDRFLVLAESSGLPALIVANKLDLREGDDDPFAAYEAIGYEVLRASVETGTGIDELRERLCGATTVLTGPSGVGKSSLLNAVEPGLELRVGDVSDAVRKGRHTTVSARLIPLSCGGFVADTPGLRELGMWNLPPEELSATFVEMREPGAACRFGNSCTHVHEPDCGVRAAVEAGAITRERYDSYVDLHGELTEAARRY